METDVIVLGVLCSVFATTMAMIRHSLVDLRKRVGELEREVTGLRVLQRHEHS